MGFAATLNVLKSSVINGISGWFRLYLAFFLTGKVPDLLLCFAFFFVVYSVYTLDRTLKSKEDEVNRPEEKNADKIIVFFIISVLLFITALILELKKISPFAALFPFVIGFLYTKRIKIGSISIRFKQGLGIKNFIVAFTWAFTIVAFMYNFTENYLQIFWLFIFFFFQELHKYCVIRLQGHRRGFSSRIDHNSGLFWRTKNQSNSSISKFFVSFYLCGFCSFGFG